MAAWPSALARRFTLSIRKRAIGLLVWAASGAALLGTASAASEFEVQRSCGEPTGRFPYPPAGDRSEDRSRPGSGAPPRTANPLSVHAASTPPTLASFQSRRGFPEAVAGDVIDLIGSGLASQCQMASAWPLPTTLDGVQVLWDGVPIPLLGVSPDWVRIQLPWEMAGLDGVELTLQRQGQSSNPLSVWLRPVAPQILSIGSSMLTPGQTITLRAVGVGPRNRNPVTGEGPSSLTPGSALTRMLVLIGDAPAPIVSDVLAECAPQDCTGVQHISIQIPSNAPTGSAIPVRLVIGEAESTPFHTAIQATAVRVTLSENSVQVKLNNSHRFTATVSGGVDQTLAWTLDNSSYQMPNQPGAIGSFSSAGLFMAAGDMRIPNWSIARATHSSGAFATALIQVVARDGQIYRIEPASPVIAPGESVTFSLRGPGGAIVDGVKWRTSDGFSSATSATYTASLGLGPSRISVWASLDGASGMVATTTLMISPPRAKITAVSLGAAHVGELITFMGTGLTARQVSAWFTSSSGGWIRIGPQSGPMFSVPRGAASGPIKLEMSSGEGSSTYLSPPYYLTVWPRLRLRASRVRVASGETVQIQVAAPDVPGVWKPTWRADSGSINSNGVFLAPAVSQTSYARIWACLPQETVCASTVVEVAPLRLEPDPLILDKGGSVQLKALRAGAEAAVEWRAMSANINVTPTGKLTAGSGPFDGGLAKVGAIYNDRLYSFMFSIRAPGALAHAAEPNDWLGYSNNSPNGRMALGVFGQTVAVKGDWVYSAARNHLALQDTGASGDYWMDVYRLDANRNPVWVDAVESFRQCAFLQVVGDTLYAVDAASPSLVLRYDISKGRPVLQGREALQGPIYEFDVRGLQLSVKEGTGGTGAVTLVIRDYLSGAMRTLPSDYVPLSGGTRRGAASSGWAAVMFEYSGTAGPMSETVVFDTTGPTAVMLAVLPSGGFNHSVVALQNLLVVGRDVYRVADGQVTPVFELPGYYVVDFDAATKRLLLTRYYSIQGDGYSVADLSDWRNPKVSAATVHPDMFTSGALGPDYFVLAGGGQNVAVYPILFQPSIQLTDTFPASPWWNDLKVRDGYVFATGPGWGYTGRSVSFGLFEVNDVSAGTANLVATLDRPGDQTGWAIELNGRYAYVGTDSSLIVYDITAPTSPAFTYSAFAPAYSLALSGKFLYAGSNKDAEKRLVTYDLSNPAEPRPVSTIILPDFAYGVAVGQGWLAAAMGNAGLAIYSLANPGAPIRVAHLTGTYWDVAGSGNLLYAAAGDMGVVILSLTTLNNPQAVSITSLAIGTELFDDTYPTALAVSYDQRGIVWISTGREGRVFGLDVRDPGNPRHIAQVVTGAGVLVYSASAAEAWNGRLFVAGNNAGFEATAPQNVGLFGAAQPTPAQVLPSRLNEPRQASAEAQAKAASREPLKSRELNRRAPAGPDSSDPRDPRPYRQERPGSRR